MRFLEKVIEHGTLKPTSVEELVFKVLKGKVREAHDTLGLTTEECHLPLEELYAKYGRDEIMRRVRESKAYQSEIRKLDAEVKRLQREAKEALRGAVIVVADNVAEYIFRDGGKEHWDVMKDFPCLMPPFKDCWVEMRVPSSFTESGSHYAGYHLLGLAPDEFITNEPETVVVNLVGKWRAFADRIYCVLRAQNYLDLSKPYGPTETYYIALDEQGVPLADFHQLHEGSDEIDALNEQRVAAYFLAPALLTLSFMHCKNVEVIENAPPPKLQKARARRGKRPLMSWKTLNIVPMQKVLRAEGKSEETGIKRAIHICRGHFKDFRDKGLFGRHKGLYWWDSQVRGSASEGVVVKNYKVNAQGAPAAETTPTPQAKAR